MRREKIRAHMVQLCTRTEKETGCNVCEQQKPIHDINEVLLQNARFTESYRHQRDNAMENLWYIVH